MVATAADPAKRTREVALPVDRVGLPDAGTAEVVAGDQHPIVVDELIGQSLALLGAVTVIVSAVLPWTRTGEGLPRDIPARLLIDPQGPASGLNLGIVLLVVGAIGALVALLTMVAPWLGFLRRLVGLATLALPLLFVIRAWADTGLGGLIDLIGAGVYGAAAGSIIQIVAGKWRGR